MMNSEMSIPLLGISNRSTSSEVPSSSPSIPSCALKLEKEVKGKKWDARAIDILEKWEIKLENTMPTNQVQKELDKFGVRIQKLLNPAEKFNKWLDSNGHGTWYKKLAIFLYKLPIRAVRNILRLVYCIIKTTIYAFVHPIKTLFDAARLLIQFIDSLTKPETYTKLGTAVIGASLGQLAITGGFGPHTYIGLAIGGALLLGGLTAGAIIAGVRADKGKGLRGAGEELWKQIKTLPETMLTGFIMGVIFGAIQQNVVKHKSNYLNAESAKEYARQYASQNGIDHIVLENTGYFYSTMGPRISLWIIRPDKLPYTFAFSPDFIVNYTVKVIPTGLALATGVGTAALVDNLSPIKKDEKEKSRPFIN